MALYTIGAYNHTRHTILNDAGEVYTATKYIYKLPTSIFELRPARHDHPAWSEDPHFVLEGHGITFLCSIISHVADRLLLGIFIKITKHAPRSCVTRRRSRYERDKELVKRHNLERTHNETDDRTDLQRQMMIGNMSVLVTDARLRMLEVNDLCKNYGTMVGFNVGLIVGNIRGHYQNMMEIFKEVHDPRSFGLHVPPGGENASYIEHYLHYQRLIHQLEGAIDQYSDILEKIPPSDYKKTYFNETPTTTQSPEELLKNKTAENMKHLEMSKLEKGLLDYNSNGTKRPIRKQKLIGNVTERKGRHAKHKGRSNVTQRNKRYPKHKDRGRESMKQDTGLWLTFFP